MGNGFRSISMELANLKQTVAGFCRVHTEFSIAVCNSASGGTARELPEDFGLMIDENDSHLRETANSHKSHRGATVSGCAAPFGERSVEETSVLYERKWLHSGQANQNCLAGCAIEKATGRPTVNRYVTVVY